MISFKKKMKGFSHLQVKEKALDVTIGSRFSQESSISKAPLGLSSGQTSLTRSAGTM